MTVSYTDMIAAFNIGSAHPGGLAVTKEMFQQVEKHPHQSILDVGCGTGRTVQYISEQTTGKIIGIDYDPKMITKAKQKLANTTNVELKTGNVEALPIDEETIDCIISESVTSFAHIPVALKEYARVLRENGILCLLEMTATMPLSPEAKQELTSFYGLSSIYTEPEWREAIERAGFTLLDSLSFAPETEGVLDSDIHQTIDPVYFDIMARHYQLTEKYRDVLGSRIYYCQKTPKRIRQHVGN
ncbi:ubiquinone/menaquinone biosynthesis C-methylase UbiE [Natronobacillus azotifigens]|uniref:Class I SAM-dependent methyltransferase n=1 Tax=Natronobacillus azotifigens TaxID=472978 RepID=A0A9J6RGV3_9BACI|nr:class I SAM-dependent methyltransferase [Natronobacillus azotifigens]MCZ0704369.1 class I SAM-dependent methyltransferase [Natronobacillus azotifigens]